MNSFIVVDFETTGTHPKQGDSIIQIGAVTIEDGQIIEQFSTLVNPGQPIPPFITVLTGITDEMVADAPVLEEVLPEFLRLLDGRTFVAHNASFDLNFLQEALLSQGYYPFDGDSIDTVELSRFLLPMQESYRLVELADEFEIQHENPHQADSDALATAELFLHLLQLLKELPLVTIQRLQLLVSSFRSDIGKLLRHMEMEKMLSLSFEEAEQAIDSTKDEQWDIYRQLALRKRPNILSAKSDPLYSDYELEVFLESLLGEGGTLSKTQTGYQRREEQEAMIRAIYEAITDEVHLFVEAGTGTGKSLAYLIPSVLWAKMNQQQVMISTHTIQLQEQLFQKDIPNLQQALPFELKVAQLKGRGNYICLRKFEHALLEPTESTHEMFLAKAQIVTWLTQTVTGDYEELSLPPAGNLLWQQIKSDTHSCLNRHCPWFSRCYYFQAKERTRDADLVIVNHALLVSDMQAESNILPPSDVMIIDEAHQLEDVASQHLGLNYSTVQLVQLLDRLEVDEENGMLDSYGRELIEWRPALFQSVENARHELRQSHIQAKEDASQWTQLLYHWALKRAKETTEIGRATIRYKLSDFYGKDERIRKTSDKLIVSLTRFAEQLEAYLNLTKSVEDTFTYSIRSYQTNMRGLLEEIKQTTQAIHILLVEEREDLVKWMEIESRTSRKHLFLFSSPLDIAEAMREQLFEKKRSVILTSATLTVKNSFDYLVERFGFDPKQSKNYRTLSLPSPFHYEEQGLLLLPADLPSIAESDGQYLNAVIQGCIDVILAAQGRTLILFTSYSMLRQVYDGLKTRLPDEEGITLLGHGIDSSNRNKLVRKFQREPRTVLLGTSSFWEGVDIPGDALSCLIIVRLPFAPPNHPLTEGRSEKLKEEKKNPFMALSLPHAIIRFKQGVGRLIRHHQDRGVIVVFDTRIVESRYGRSFLKSLPPFQTKTGTWTQLREMIRPFLNGMLVDEES
ncbi:ATP-dependent DNA helicase DinG [Brevibacillus ginsengisoli]|uniref:ATP-dependent DNA helicase DinG n=1 Tax=Brevibacillus ginsengisoli TaxID=363854 RepID=UPI003CFA6BF8